MFVMLVICFPMDHHIISDYIGHGIYVLKMTIHVVLEKVLSLVKPKRHFCETVMSPWGIESGQELRCFVHG